MRATRRAPRGYSVLVAPTSSALVGYARGVFRSRSSRRVALLSLLALAISPVPGVGTLGYFSALVLSLPSAVAGAGVGLDVTLRQRARRRDHGRLSDLARMANRELLALVGLPLLILLAASAYNPNCDPWMGVAFHVMGPGFSVACGFTAGVLATIVAERRPRATVAAGLVILASTLLGLWRLYTEPCVFFFDPFWGWFSGPIYDEQVGITTRFLRFRGYNLLGISGVLAVWSVCARPDRAGVMRPRDAGGLSTMALAAALLSGAGWMGLQPSRYGFTTDRAHTEEALSGTLRTDHFVLHYVPNTSTALRIDALAAEHEFAWHELERSLGRAPAGPIHSYIYASQGQKRRLFGVGGVEVSLPWKRSLYLTATAFPMRSLHHELAHTFGAAFGDPILGLSMKWLPVPQFNTALLEGFAVAMDPRPRYRMDIHAQAATLDRLGVRPNLEALMGLGFYQFASARAYTASGSFVRWLLETRGGARVGELYATAGDFESVYGENLPDLEAQWLEFLRVVPLDAQSIASMEERFKRRSVFQRPCAHRVARVRVEAAQAQASGDDARALELRDSLCEIEPDRMEHYATLARVLATFGRYEEAFDAVARGQAVPEAAHSAALDASMAALEGDLLVAAGRLDEAVIAYERALASPSDDATIRSVRLRRDAAADPNAAAIVHDYFGRFRRVRTDASTRTNRLYRSAELTAVPGWSRMGHYLLGQQMLRVDDLRHAREHLERALDTGPRSPNEGLEVWRLPAADSPPLPAAFQRATLRALAEVSLRSGDLEDCEMFLRRWSAAGDTRGDAVAIDKWRRRLRFHRERSDARAPGRR
jgi:tetratricopeptide (TPR) repeat protein